MSVSNYGGMPNQLLPNFTNMGSQIGFFIGATLVFEACVAPYYRDTGRHSFVPPPIANTINCCLVIAGAALGAGIGATAGAVCDAVCGIFDT